MTLLLNALHGKNFSRPPIWLMRQAGRYMPEYQAIREKHGLNTMFTEKNLIIETTLLPIRLLDVDAAIVFADILTVLSGLNKKWTLVEGIGPVIDPIKNISDLTRIDPHDAYPHISGALLELKKIIQCPLIGFAGGPLTIAAYLVEGKMSKEMHILKRWIYTDPVSLHKILDLITHATIDYLQLQIDSGIDVLQIFDSWAGLLTPKAFQEFALPYLKKIIDKISGQVPIILFCRGSCLYAEKLASLQPQAISFDWHQEMRDLMHIIPNSIALQGNLDPCVLLGSYHQIEQEAKRILKQMEHNPRFIFNLGHGILPQTPFDNVKYLVEYVKSFQIS